jgi:hypothetical protein
MMSCSFIGTGSRALAACPGALRPIDEIDGEFVLRQRLRIRTEELDFPMRLVVQKTADTLIAIGFNPMGAKLFSIQQRSEEPQVDALPQAVLPVSPLSVLRDLHRIRFLSASRPQAGEGRSSRSFDGTHVDDTWRSGTLIQREVTSPHQRLPVTLDFEPDASGVVVNNPGCGYVSEWTTLSEEVIR